MPPIETSNQLLTDDNCFPRSSPLGRLLDHPPLTDEQAEGLDPLFILSATTTQSRQNRSPAASACFVERIVVVD
jgi:hypothetical protein